MMYGVRGEAIIPQLSKFIQQGFGVSKCRRVEALPEPEPRLWENREGGRILNSALRLGTRPNLCRLNHFDRRLLQLKLAKEGPLSRGVPRTVPGHGLTRPHGLCNLPRPLDREQTGRLPPLRQDADAHPRLLNGALRPCALVKKAGFCYPDESRESHIT
jgi:hypothetical protein